MIQVLLTQIIQVIFSFFVIFILAENLPSQVFGSYASVLALSTISLNFLNFGITTKYIYKTALAKKIKYCTQSNIYSIKIFLQLPFICILALVYNATVNLCISIVDLLSIVIYSMCLNLFQLKIGELNSLKLFTKMFYYEFLFRSSLISILFYCFFYNDQNVIIMLSIASFCLSLFTIPFNRLKLKYLLFKSYLKLALSSKSYFFNSLTEILFWRLGIVILPFFASTSEVSSLQIYISYLSLMSLVPLSIIKYFFPNMNDSSYEIKNIFKTCFLIFISYYLLYFVLSVYVLPHIFKIYFSSFAIVFDNLVFTIIFAFVISMSRFYRTYMAMQSRLNFHNMCIMISLLITIIVVYLHNASLSFFNVLLYMLIFEIIVVCLSSVNYAKKNYNI